MANTDDIAEKVADLLVDQTAKAANTGLDISHKTVKSIGVLTQKGLNKLLENSKSEKELKRLLGIEGEITPAQMSELVKRLGLQSSTVRVVNSDAKEYETLLRQNGVLYAKMDIKDDNAKMFIFMNRDREKILNLGTVLKANRGLVTEVRPDLYINQLAPDNVRVIDGLDAVELELFRHYSRYENLLYTAIQRGNKHAVVFEDKDYEKARKILLHTGWDLTGYSGARNREQIEHRLKGRTAIRIALDEAERELFIVNKYRPGEYINITAEDFATYKQGKKITSVPRSNPDFYTRCLAAAEGMEGAVILTADEFHQDMTPEELANRRTIDLFDRQYDDLIEINRQDNLASLVAMKSGHDDEYNATWGLWDPSVSYSEFSGYEFIMDDEERDAREAEFEHFKKAAFYVQDNYSVQDIHLDERNVDFIIQKAEEKRKSQAQSNRPRTPQQAKDAQREESFDM